MEDIKEFIIEHKWVFVLISAAFLLLVDIISGVETISKPFRWWWKRRKALKNYYTFTGKSSSLTPDKVWEGIRVGKYNKHYHPRLEEDGLINDGLKNKKNVLIIGRPLSGKTRAAYQALTKLNEPQKVAVPRCTDIKLEDFRFPKASIIFINDLHEFVDKQNFERLWNTATDVKNNVTIIATCQSAEMKKVENKIKDLKGIFENIIELPKATEEDAREVANKVGIDWKDVEFDKTIGSVFLRLDEMRRRFNEYSYEDPKRLILQALRSLYICGIYEEKYVFPLKWIKIATKKVGLEGEDYQWNAWLEDLRAKEFITFAGRDRVRAEEMHLKVVVKPPGTGEILDVSEDTIAAFSDEPEALFRLGYRADTIRNLEIAIKAYSRTLEINPRDAEAYVNRGAAYGSKGDYDRAIADYNKALEINPRDAEAYYNRGNAYYKKGEYDRAIADYNKALEINPREALAYNNRGLAYSNKGDYDRAIADYNKALEINPRYALAYNNRGSAYGSKGEHDHAIADYNKAIELNPRDAEAYYNRGTAYSDKGEYDRAILDYNEALEINPRYAKAYNNRGIAYGKKGQYDRAIGDFNKALKINPRDALAYYNRAVAYYFKQEYDKAWEDVYKAQELGYQVNPGFLELLREASGRQR